MSTGIIMDIAKGALAASRYGLDVTGHNISNVNNSGFSRQGIVQEAKQPLSYNGFQVGCGVTTSQIIRKTNQFMENRLSQQGSNLAYSAEMENYVKILEGIFNENSETSISSLMNEYWNLWNDISNNPSGASERISLYEFSTLLADRFKSLDGELEQLQKDLTMEMDSAVNAVNQISGEIASLNKQIVSMDSIGMANDLRDKRNALVTELSQYIDTNTFEQDNGSLTIVSARGSILVHGIESYSIALGGVNGDRVEWQSSSGTTLDITAQISKGKMGGWLDMRDEVIAKYQMDFDSLAKEFIWVTNQQHSQGVGLEAFGNLTGGYAVTSETNTIGSVDSGLSYYDKIIDGNFKLWVYDAGGNAVIAGGTNITIDADTTSLVDVLSQINTVDANITGSVNGGKLVISASNGYTFAFSDDSSNALAAIGLNTLYKGSGSDNIGVNDMISSKLSLIAAARIDSDGGFVSGDNSNAVSITDLQFEMMEISNWNCDRIKGITEASISSSIDGYYHSMVGSIGSLSESIYREKSFTETMVNKIGEMRDSISAVSLDEEMTNLMKFQHAYSAAAKLINTADEMMNTLLELT